MRTAIYLQVNANVLLAALPLGTPAARSAEEIARSAEAQFSPLALDRTWEYFCQRAGVDPARSFGCNVCCIIRGGPTMTCPGFCLPMPPRSISHDESQSVLHSWCVPSQWRAPTVVGGEGAWLHLEDGRRVLDMSSLAECSHLGHQHPRLVQAVQRQAAEPPPF